MAFSYKKFLNSENRCIYRNSVYHVHGKLFTFQAETIKFVRSLLQGLRWSFINVCNRELLKSGGGDRAQLFRHDENGLLIQGSDADSRYGTDWIVDHKRIARNTLVDGTYALLQFLGKVDECPEN
jgi:hypothetical protein